MSELTAFLCLAMFKHNGRYYRTGDTIYPTNEDELGELLARGVIEDLPRATQVPDEVLQSSSNLIDAVVAVIGDLDKNNDAHFTKSGVPKTDELSLRVGRKVSAQERDEAFALFSANHTAATDTDTGNE